MELIRLSRIVNKAKNSIVAIGNFDGVHIGHQEVINFAKSISKKKKKSLSVITFEPHPKCFFKKQYENFRITPFRVKYEEIKKLGVDFYFNFKFPQTFSNISANSFIEDILIKKMQVSHIVTGFDFVFGHKQQGDTKLLESISISNNAFKFSEVKEFKKNKIIEVSSSKIREFLKAGDLKSSKEILGRDWSIQARVVRGKSLGRKIGFPTANIILKRYCDLCFGVYAVEIRFKKDFFKSTFKGVANYGIKPTFLNNEPLLEINIFDFDKDIYGELIEVTFKFFIRREEKFLNIEDLKEQITKDVSNCKKLMI